MKRLLDIFSLDLRSLAVARILLGLTFLGDLVCRLGDVDSFYSDSGILSRADYFTNFYFPGKFSLLFLGGSSFFVYTFFIVGILAGVFYTIGLRTRISSLLCFVVYASLHARFPLINHGGDNLMRLLFFYSIFLPMNGAFSFDKNLSNQKVESYKVRSGMSFLWILQLCCVYFFTVYYKLDPAWHRDFDAVYYSLQLDAYTTFIGKYFSQHFFLTKLMTAFTFLAEALSPLLLLIPFAIKYTRSLAILTMIVFHLGIALMYKLGTFPTACMALWLALIPSELWKSLDTKFKLPSYKLFQLIGHSKIILKSSFSHFLGFILSAVILLWNLEGTNAIKNFDLKSPINEIVFALQLNQQWNMFAPSPMKDDGWLTVVGQMEDGSQFDIFHKKPATFVMPESVSSTYKNSQWRKFLLSLWNRENNAYRPFFGAWLCRQWNEHYELKVKDLEVYFNLEVTKLDAKQMRIDKVLMFKFSCE